MVNININMGRQANFGGGFPGANPMGGFGANPGMGGGFGGFPGMNGMGGFGGFPGMNGMGGGFGMDPMQQMMMQSMNMMSMAMMALMTRMMAQQVAMLGQSAFGGGMGGGNPMGSPLGGFLGSGNAPSAGGAGGAGGANEAGGAGASGPAGKVGNVDVEKLVNAIDPGYRKAARQHWPAILAECQKQGVTNKAQIAYILATTVHESGAGAHMEEFASGAAYQGRRDLGNTQPGDGVRFKGRGYVQITGRNNYPNWSKKLGVDLVGNPELAERPEIAAKILVGGMKEGSFTGKKLDDYINGSKTDFAGARRIVNGTDKAATFANTAQKILAAMG